MTKDKITTADNRDLKMKLADNPRFVRAEEPGIAYVIVGAIVVARPSRSGQGHGTQAWCEGARGA